MRCVGNLRIEGAETQQKKEAVIEAAKESDHLKVNETHPVVLTLWTDDEGSDDD